MTHQQAPPSTMALHPLSTPYSPSSPVARPLHQQQHRNGSGSSESSLYEGFGMPILEAFAYGCPVLLNNKSCFPEIAGDAAVYFLLDEQGSDLVEKMKMAFSWSNEERESIIQSGYERLNLYSWQKSAEQLKDLYVSIT